MSLPTKIHMTANGAVPLTLWANRMASPVSWKRASLCGKYLRLELTTQDWKKVDCKMCLKVKGAKKDNQ